MERTSIVKTSILLKAIYRFNAISIKIPVAFSQKWKKKSIPKFLWNDRRPKMQEQF